MIYFYSGTPGSGKSLHVAKDIYTQLRRGKNVIANFDINYKAVPGKDNYGNGKGKKKGYFIQKENHELSPEWLIDFAVQCHRRNEKGNIAEGQTWLIIDECQLIFNCRSWNDKSRLAWCSFFTQHRKYGYNIILISQFDRLIDRAIRSLIEYEIKHRKVNNFGTFGFLIGAFLMHPVFIAVDYWYGVKEKVGVEFFVGHEKYYRLYDSYKLFDVAG